MELLEGLLTRRSVRKYSEQNISRETIIDVIRAAQYAPSAHNRQPWEFLVIEDKTELGEFRTIQPWTGFVKDAAVAILMCADLNVAHSKDNYTYADIDCAMAAENLLLAAHAKGLGACICGVAPMPEVMEKFAAKYELPANIRPFALIALGTPEEMPKQPDDRFKESKIHWYRW